MNRTLQLSMIAATAMAFTLSPMRRAIADDETHDTEIKIQAPLDATNCDATPPTITVLGLTIDVSKAAIETSGKSPDPGTTDDSSTSHKQGSRKGGNDPAPGGCYYCTPAPATPTPTPAVPALATNSCAGLALGKRVEVQFASDGEPLVASKVEQSGGGNAESEIKAPIQNVDPSGPAITLLGLTIDVSGAGLDGSDDDDRGSQPIDLSQLMIGQFAEVKLAASTLPLVATELEVKNFSNQVEVELEDSKGQDVDDVDAAGNPVDDVSVDVVDLVKVQKPTPVGAVAGTPPASTHKQLHLHTGTNGSCTISGLPTGFARVRITRVHGGITSVSQRIVRIRGNETRQLRVRLRPAHR